MTCPDCGAPDDQGCRKDCPSIVRDVLRTGVGNELEALRRELQACHDAIPEKSVYQRGARQGFALAIRAVTTRIPR